MVNFAKLRERNERRKAFVEDARRNGLPFVGYCGDVNEHGNVCGLPQVMCPSGEVCAEGHGGADTLPEKLPHKPYLKDEIEMARTRTKRTPAENPEPQRELTRADIDDPGFEVREGDRLTVVYGGVKLQIAPYTTVEIDSGIYSRTLEVGDDPLEQWDRIHGYLHKKITAEARAKLATYAAELASAKRKAGGRDE